MCSSSTMSKNCPEMPGHMTSTESCSIHLLSPSGPLKRFACSKANCCQFVSAGNSSKLCPELSAWQTASNVNGFEVILVWISKMSRFDEPRWLEWSNGWNHLKRETCESNGHRSIYRTASKNKKQIKICSSVYRIKLIRKQASARKSELQDSTMNIEWCKQHRNSLQESTFTHRQLEHIYRTHLETYQNMQLCVQDQIHKETALATTQLCSQDRSSTRQFQTMR